MYVQYIAVALFYTICSMNKCFKYQSLKNIDSARTWIFIFHSSHIFEKSRLSSNLCKYLFFAWISFLTGLRCRVNLVLYQVQAQLESSARKLDDRARYWMENISAGKKVPNEWKVSSSWKVSLTLVTPLADAFHLRKILGLSERHQQHTTVGLEP